MSENSLGKISYWDKKAESLGVHVCKIQLNAEFFRVRDDKLNPLLMTKCPTQLGYGTINVIKPGNLAIVDLYQKKEKLWAIITLGQERAMTVSENYPNRLEWEFVSKACKLK